MSSQYIPCTLQTCPIQDGIIAYQPNLAGNGFLLGLFALVLIVQLYLGFKYCTWTYSIGVCGGLILEVVGYVGRLQLHDDPFNFNFFIEYLVCLTIAPAFLSASIYVCFCRMILLGSPALSRIKPKFYSTIFITSDLICLILQAAGGALTATSGGRTSSAENMRQTGINVMIAGLALQVVSLVTFITCAGDYILRCQKKQKTSRHVAEAPTPRKCLLTCLTISTFAILIRSLYRTAELKDGFQGKFASNETTFMIFEGAMIAVACICLTIGHPGLWLGSPWKLRTGEVDTEFDTIHGRT